MIYSHHFQGIKVSQFCRMSHFLSVILIFFSIISASAQSKTLSNSGFEEVFSGFSGVAVDVKRKSRAASASPDELEAFSKGHINVYDFKSQYKNVFLGSDFFDIASKTKSCDSLQQKMGKIKAHFIPVSDGHFFRQSHFKNIEELNGYYLFRNSKNLPGILPNVEIWVRMETYRHGKATDKNCLVIKFLIPEEVNGKLENKAYAMRNDGILVTIPQGTDPDFSLKMDFSQYCIFPLTDPTGTTYLIGKDFNMLGNFAHLRQCDKLNGFLFPTSRKGTPTGCVFFRKSNPDIAPQF
jgi:hypothetical protein